MRREYRNKDLGKGNTMNTHRFLAPDMRTALRRARKALGPDAVLVMSRPTDAGTEVVAARAGEVGQPSSDHGEASAPARMGLAALREELHGMHADLHEQVSALASAQYERRHPLRVKLIDAMTAAGFDSELARSLAMPVEPDTDERVAWEETLGRVAGAIALSAEDPLADTGTVIAVGPPGVGKTTTLTKLAARAVRRSGTDQVRMISLDQRRLGARQQLERIGEVLQVPVSIATTPDALRGALKSGKRRALTLIDTGGLPCGDPSLGELIRELGHIAKARPYLVMSAALQRGVFAQAARHYGCEDIAGVILTHLDEAHNLGESLSVMIRHRLRAAAISDSASSPTGLHRTNIVELVDTALRGRLDSAPVVEPPFPEWRGMAAHA